jgi:hypothetical protein
MAALTVETFRRLLAGTLTWMQIIIDMETGNMRSVPADPQTLTEMLGKNSVQIQ